MAKALVIDGRVVQVWATGLTPPIDPAILPPGGALVEAPANVVAGWYLRNGTFRMPHASGMETAPFHDNYINAQSAKLELILSDRVMVRDFEEGTPPNVDWVAYRNTLRTIVALENDTSSPPIQLPPRPAFPHGGTETAV